MSFRKIDISELSFNPFEKIGKEWMLLTGGSIDDFNTMTASWGQLGVIWNKNVLTCYIRPNRYTYDFVERSECFTASFFGEEFRKALSFCGSHSGRDCDKMAETGLVPVLPQALQLRSQGRGIPHGRRTAREILRQRPISSRLYCGDRGSLCERIK